MINLVDIANRTIKRTNKSDKLFKLDYDTSDIIKLIKMAHNWGLSYTKELAKNIPGETLTEYCSNLYKLLKENVKYKVDSLGSQNVKSPGRVWFDKECDCKSFSIFIGTTLQNKGIKFLYRFVSFVEDNKNVTHVYIIVPTSKGSYITMDVVYTGFNQEKKPFYNNIDMPGLHYLGSIGSASTKLLDLGNKDIADISDGEMDLLIARDRLQTEKAIVEGIQGIGSLKAEKYQDSIDMINDAISAVHDYEMGAIGDINAELGLMCGQAHRKEYSVAQQVAGIGDIKKRVLHRNVNRKKLQHARRIQRKKLTPFQIANIWGIGDLSGHSIGKGFFKKVAQKVAKSKILTVATGGANKLLTKDTRKAAIKTVTKVAKKVVKVVAKVATLPMRLAAKAILEIQLPKSAPFFLYLFLNDPKLLAKAPDKVRKKRAKSEKIADFIVNGIGMKRDHFMGIVRNGIMKKYGKSPENVIADQLKGIAGIGIIDDAIKMITEIISTITKLFGKKKDKDLDASASDAPNATDWPTSGTNTPSTKEFADAVKKQQSDTFDPSGSGSGTLDNGGKKVWSSF